MFSGELIAEPICLIEYPPLDKSTILDSYFQEELVLLYFHLSRTKNGEKMGILKQHLGQVLDTFKKNLFENPQFLVYFKLFYRLIGQTADIFYGKGEHDLTYMMIWVWYQRYPVLAIYAIHQLVKPVFGSWRHMKYLCHHLRGQGAAAKSLINMCVDMMNQQLNKDLKTWEEKLESCSRNDISNLAKWIPREHKKFDWLYELLVLDWADKNNPWIMKSTRGSSESLIAATKKCKGIYRKNIAFLNRILDTTEIKLCEKNRHGIIPQNVSGYTLIKQPGLLYADDVCSQNFKEYFDKKFMDFELELSRTTEMDKDIEIEKKGVSSNVNVLPPLAYFVKEAFQLIHSECPNNYRSNLLDKQWKILSKSLNIGKIENLIPILDMGFSIQMSDAESYYTAIGIAILVAEHSSFGKRILVADHSPTWVNMEECNGFVSMIQFLHDATSSNRNTLVDFNKAIDMIILGLLSYNMEVPDRKQKLIRDIENLRLLFLSDFRGFLSDNFNAFDKINERFIEELGTESPQFIFWNVGSYTTDVFLPCSVNQRNTMFLSGFSANLVKVLKCKRDYTPYRMICKILENKRYDLFGNYIDTLVIHE